MAKLPEKIKFYSKNTCVTCKKAKAFLAQNKADFEEIDIVKNPPPKKLLEAVVDGGNVKASLNSRSSIYKSKKLGEKTPDKKTAIELMLKDPNLIKRPVIVNAKGKAQLGFEPSALKAFLKS